MIYINTAAGVEWLTGVEKRLYPTVYCSGFRPRKTIKYEFPFWVLLDRMRLNKNPQVCNSRQQNDDLNTVKYRYVVELEEVEKSFRYRSLS